MAPKALTLVTMLLVTFLLVSSAIGEKKNETKATVNQFGGGRNPYPGGGRNPYPGGGRNPYPGGGRYPYPGGGYPYPGGGYPYPGGGYPYPGGGYPYPGGGYPYPGGGGWGGWCRWNCCGPFRGRCRCCSKKEFMATTGRRH